MTTSKTIWRPSMTSTEIELCLLHMIRVPELFDYARRNLAQNPFSPIGEQHLNFIWESALAVANRNGGKLPDKASDVIRVCCIIADLHKIQYGAQILPQ